jgi:hypothetical protein
MTYAVTNSVAAIGIETLLVLVGRTTTADGHSTDPGANRQ